MPSPEFFKGFSEGTERMRMRREGHFLGLANFEGLPSGDTDFGLGVVARSEYEAFAGGVPKHLHDVPVKAVQLSPNGKMPIPEDKIDLFFDQF